MNLAAIDLLVVAPCYCCHQKANNLESQIFFFSDSSQPQILKINFPIFSLQRNQGNPNLGWIFGKNCDTGLSRKYDCQNQLLPNPKRLVDCCVFRIPKILNVTVKHLQHTCFGFSSGAIHDFEYWYSFSIGSWSQLYDYRNIVSAFSLFVFLPGWRAQR